MPDKITAKYLIDLYLFRTYFNLELTEWRKFPFNSYLNKSANVEILNSSSLGFEIYLLQSAHAYSG